MKKNLVVTISIFLLIPNTIKSTNHFLMFAGIGISLTSLYGLYRLTKKTPKFKPTVTNLNTLTFNSIATSLETQSKQVLNLQELVDHVSKNKIPKQSQLAVSKKKSVTVHRGISIDPKEKLIFLSSRGYAKKTKLLTNDKRELVKRGGCAIAAHILIQDNIVHNHPCITFDYPDDRATFSFGQDMDCQCLTTMWKTISQQYPNTAIVGIGDCRGARALLELATIKPKNLKALILFSPYISSRDLTKQVAKNHLSWLPGSNFLLHTFFRSYFSSYNPNNDTLVHKINLIDKKIPIFIGHRKNDKLVSEKSMQHLLGTLKKAGHKNIYFFVVQDNTATHSRISHIPELQQAVNAFLAHYGLPHNKKLATQGKQWLMHAHRVAQEEIINVVINYS